MSVDEIYKQGGRSVSVTLMIEEKFQLARPNLDAAELAVMEDLRIASHPISQAYIARSRPFLGAHPHWEGNRPSQETTLRRVRSIINSLRVKHHIAILADRRGYWLARNLEEAETFLDAMEEQARSAAKSYMVTFHAMSKSIDGLRPRDGVGLFEEEEVGEELLGHLTGVIGPPPGRS